MNKDTNFKFGMHARTESPDMTPKNFFRKEAGPGSRDPGHAPFSKNFSGIMSELSLGACMPNLKFVSLTILELLTPENLKVT